MDNTQSKMSSCPFSSIKMLGSGLIFTLKENTTKEEFDVFFNEVYPEKCWRWRSFGNKVVVWKQPCSEMECKCNKPDAEEDIVKCDVCGCDTPQSENMGACRGSNPVCPKKVDKLCNGCGVWCDEAEDWFCPDCAEKCLEECECGEVILTKDSGCEVAHPHKCDDESE